MFVPFSSTDPEHRYKEARGLFIILGAVTLTLLANVLLIQNDAPSPSQVPAPTSELAVATGTDWPRYTLTEVALHNSPTDCWMAAYGNVYDITPYVAASTHPGGQSSLTAGCGTEATATFDRIHSAGARAELESFQIGILTE